MLKNGMYIFNNGGDYKFTDVPAIPGSWGTLLVHRINNDPDFGRVLLCIGDTSVNARWFFGVQAGTAIFSWKELRTSSYPSASDVSADGYLLSRPDTWPANTERDFGNNLYGRRCTGTFNWTYSVGVQELLILNHYCDVGKLEDFGGDVNYTADGGIPLDYGYFNSGAMPEHYARIFRQLGYIQVFYYHKGMNGVNLPYDIWFTWKKR
jgi:hypothetical protein